MRTEKHIIKNRYSTHGIHRNIPVYEINTLHCSASPMEGYKGTEVTLIDDAAWNEKFSAWALTGATATGNNIVLNNDVTAQGLYETAKNLTLQTDGHGQIAANKMSGFIGDQVTLSNSNPELYYAFSGYTITGANLTGDKFNFIGSDVTAKAWYTMTGVPVHNIFSGGTAEMSILMNNTDAHTFFLYSPSTVTDVTDPYVVVQYDYKAIHADRAKHVVNMNFNYSGGAWNWYSMSFTENAENLVDAAKKGIMLATHHNFYTILSVNSAVASISVDNQIVAKNANLGTTEHHYKYIAKSNGSEVSAYVDGTYYGKIKTTNDPKYRTKLCIQISGDGTTAYLHNISYVSTSSWNDATAYNL